MNKVKLNNIILVIFSLAGLTSGAGHLFSFNPLERTVIASPSAEDGAATPSSPAEVRLAQATPPATPAQIQSASRPSDAQAVPSESALNSLERGTTTAASTESISFLAAMTNAEDPFLFFLEFTDIREVYRVDKESFSRVREDIKAICQKLQIHPQSAHAVWRIQKLRKVTPEKAYEFVAANERMAAISEHLGISMWHASEVFEIQEQLNITPEEAYTHLIQEELDINREDADTVRNFVHQIYNTYGEKLGARNALKILRLAIELVISPERCYQELRSKILPFAIELVSSRVRSSRVRSYQEVLTQRNEFDFDLLDLDTRDTRNITLKKEVFPELPSDVNLSVFEFCKLMRLTGWNLKTLESAAPHSLGRKLIRTMAQSVHQRKSFGEVVSLQFEIEKRLFASIDKILSAYMGELDNPDPENKKKYAGQPVQEIIDLLKKWRNLTIFDTQSIIWFDADHTLHLSRGDTKQCLSIHYDRQNERARCRFTLSESERFDLEIDSNGEEPVIGFGLRIGKRVISMPNRTSLNMQWLRPEYIEALLN